MMEITMPRPILGLFAAIPFFLSVAHAAIPSTVSYQGELRENGLPREGVIDLVFAVLDPQGATSQLIFAPDVPVVRGLFTAQLALSPTVVGNAQDYQLLIGVRDGALDAGSYEFLQPSQPLTSVPFALNSGLLEGKSLSGVVQQGTGVKRATFLFETFPAVPASSQFASLGVVAPGPGTLVVRARGFCNLRSNATASGINLAVGTDSTDAFSQPVTGWGTLQIEANAPRRQSMFSAERLFPLSQGGAMTVKLFGKREHGTANADCTGSLTAEYFAGSL